MIGGRCKDSNVFSQAVLMAEGLLCGVENSELFVKAQKQKLFGNLVRLKK